MIVGIALVGTGSIAETHAKAIANVQGCTLVAVRSSDKERAEQFAKKFNIPKAYTDYEEMLKDEQVNAVDIVTVNNQHAELGIKAAEAGKHILVEKPIDTSIEKAQQLIDACKEKQVKLSVISQYRFDEAVGEVKKMVEKGELGKLVLGNVSVKWSRSADYYNSSGAWRKKGEHSGGGVLMVQAIHHLDLLLWLFGEVESVHGITGNVKHAMEVEDTALAVLKFKNGAMAVVEATTSLPKSMSDKLEIHGDKGSVVLTRQKFMHRISSLKTGSGMLDKMKRFSKIKKGTIQAQIENFVSAIKDNEDVKVTGEDGLKALKTIQAIYESERLKREVKMP